MHRHLLGRKWGAAANTLDLPDVEEQYD